MKLTYDEAKADSTLPELSQRERQVFARLAAGHTSMSIALNLGVSAYSVGEYKRRFMGKLGLRSNAEITMLAHRLGILGVA